MPPHFPSSREKNQASNTMSSLMGSHGMALATATAMAVSGTVILIALCRPRPQPLSVVHERCHLRPCITSAERRKRKSHKKSKSVRFGEDVIVEFNDHSNNGNRNGNDSAGDDEPPVLVEEEEEMVVTSIPETKITRNAGPDRAGYKAREMPANRAALYSGILQARMQRMACY